MLDLIYNDQFSIRRLAGVRDSHGEPSFATVVETDTNGDNTDVPVFIECYVDRRKRGSRAIRENTKSVDVTLYYTVSDVPAHRLRDEDLIVLQSSGETFRVDSIHEQVSSVEGSEYATVGISRVKTPVAPNAATPDDV